MALYVAKAILVIAHTPQGDRYAYAGQPIDPAVPAEELARLAGEGFIEAIPDEVPAEPAAEQPASGTEPAVSPGSIPDLEAMTLADLRDFAAAHNIDLQGATRKVEMIAAIEAAQQ